MDRNFRIRAHDLMQVTPSLILLLSATMLASCGGGASDAPSGASNTNVRAQAVTGRTVPGGWAGRAPKMEVINGITVPPEPAPTVNNATVGGVDVNANGVRDDVERLVARSSTTSSSLYPIKLTIASNLQKIVSAPVELTEVELDAIYKEISCANSKLLTAGVPTLEREILSATLNSESRRTAAIRSTLHYGGYLGSENDCQ